MTPADIENHINKLKDRGKELETALSAPDVYSDLTKFRQMSQELSKLDSLFTDFDNWKSALQSIDDDQAQLAVETDQEMRELFETEIADFKEKCSLWEKSIQLALLPPDPNDAKNIIVEIKPAAGGDEAALFAGDLFRAYMHYAEKQNWKIEVLDESPSDLGGIKNVSFSNSV